MGRGRCHTAIPRYVDYGRSSELLAFTKADIDPCYRSPTVYGQPGDWTCSASDQRNLSQSTIPLRPELTWSLFPQILGPGAAKQCTYNYSTAFSTVREYNDFNQQLTRWGESGVWGFLTLLNSRPAAHLLSQSIATEARQQMVFRQFAGAPAMDVYFEPGIPQAWSWTLLAPYIQSCPKENPRVEWSNFPKLNVDNNPTLRYEGSRAAVSTNITQLVNVGETIYFSWEDPGKKVGPDLSYTTSKNGGTPTHALWVHQINATLAPLTITGPNSGYAKLPGGDVYDTDIASECRSSTLELYGVALKDNRSLSAHRIAQVDGSQRSPVLTPTSFTLSSRDWPCYQRYWFRCSR